MPRAVRLNTRVSTALGLILCLISLFASTPPSLTAPKPLVVSFIDVGQGDAALLQTPSGKNILVDTGPPAGRDSLFDYLDFRGVKNLALLIASHPHRDHIGNAEEVLTALPTGGVYDGGFVTGSEDQENMLTVIKKKKIPFFNVGKGGLAGTSTSLGDEITMEILQPKLPYLNNTHSDPNNNSVVVRIRKGKVSFLFTGDQEAEERERLLAGGADLKSTFYKVAHHGSYNGTDDAFLKRISPKEAVISCAPHNSYGHPHKKALDALEKANVRVWRTDKQGTIKAVTDGKDYDVVALGKQEPG